MNGMPKNNIFDAVINQDLCVGCGACLYSSSNKNLKMDWNQEGFLIPILNNQGAITKNSLEVCPFNPIPEKEVRTEDEIANLFLKDTPKKHPKLGHYFNTYVGYSKEFRLTSSSGGLATYILSELFERNLIDAVITVGESENNHYEYKLVKTKNDLLSTSKTKYYPVTMAEALKELKNFNGKVAVVGIGCFIKAVRLLQYYNPELREKIFFTIGIICGGLKSKFFAEYLAAKAGVRNNEFTKPFFRIKDLESTAGDYSFGCTDIYGKEKQIKMKPVGDMWGSGMFKCNACDYCDDVTTELADISLGDAWLEPYIADGKGTNVIISRSSLAEKILIDGKVNTKLHLDELDLDLLINSQRGSYNHRQIGMPYRINIAQKKGLIVPPKRHERNNVHFDFKIVQYYRMMVRKKSLEYWGKFMDDEMFDVKLKRMRSRLKKVTRLYHYRRAMFSKKIIHIILKKTSK